MNKCVNNVIHGNSVCLL